MTPESIALGNTRPTNSLLTVIDTYLKMIDRGVVSESREFKRMFLFRMGVLTDVLEDHDLFIERYTEMGLFPSDLRPFYNKCVVTNLFAYAKLMIPSLTNRVNNQMAPKGNVVVNSSGARREFYWPSSGFLKDILKFCEDRNAYGATDALIGNRLESLAVAAQHELDKVLIMSGVMEPYPAVPEECKMVLVQLFTMLEMAVRTNEDYRINAAPILRILWVFGRLFYGDVDPQQMTTPVQSAALMSRIRISDAVLAATPLPTVAVLEAFRDTDEPRISNKACLYLEAVECFLRQS